jgi:hypothetical protein
MIDPKDFVKTADTVEIIDPGIRVSGNFSCQECDGYSDHATLDEHDMILTYQCSDNHINEAKL